MHEAIAGIKLLGTMATTGLFAVAIDNATNVPLVWLIGGIGAIAAGCWKIASRLQSIEDRISSLEARNKQKDEKENKE